MTAVIAATRRHNPYIGPRAFRRGETIYGREREATKLAALLIAERIVLLHSPSGAGKTSLIQAALVPQLGKPESQGGENFRVLPLMRVNLEPPTTAGLPAGCNRYVWSAISSLEAERPHSQQRSPEELARLSLTAYLDELHEGDERDQVLVFDQFEEILTVDPTDWKGHDTFFRQVGAALTARERARWALFSMREEYIGGLDRYVRRVPTHLGVSFRLDFLDREAAHRAVQEPSAKLGVRFSRTAANELVDDLSMSWTYRLGRGRVREPGPYVEPVHLQVVCHRLWSSLSASTPTIKEIKPRHLKQFKKVDRALADYYSDGVRTVAEETEVSERALRDWFERSLISEKGFRQHTTSGPEPGGEAAERALQRLEGEGIYLIRSEQRRGELRWYELAHDRLIDPVRDSNAEWRDQHLNRFQRLAERWSREQSDLLLLVGTELDEFGRWMADHEVEATPDEQRFLEACNKARAQRRLWRRIKRVAAIVAAIVLILAAWAIKSSRDAARQAQLARSRGLVAAAVGNLDEDPELSILLALAAVRANPAGDKELRPDERDILYESIAASRVQARFTSASATGSRMGFADVDLQPGGNVVAFARATGGVELWSNESARHLRDLVPPSTSARQGSSPAVARVAFSPDGRQLAAADQDGTATVWDVASGRRVHRLRTAIRLTSIAFSADGTLLVTGGVDGNAIVWDAKFGRKVAVLPHLGPVEAVAFGQGDRVATSSSRTIRLWEASSGRQTGQPYRASANISFLAFSPNGSRLAAANADGTATLWEVADRQQLPALSGHTNSVLWVGFAPDGRRVATTSSDGTAKVWDAVTGRELLTLRGHTAAVGGAAFAPDGTSLLTASSDGTGRRWLVASGHTGFVNSVAFDPLQKRLATASTDRTVRIWEVATRQQRRILPGHRGDVREVVFDRQGNRLATASEDGTARIWDAETGRQLQVIDGGVPVNAVAFAPDGSRLALADGRREGVDVGGRLGQAAAGVQGARRTHERHRMES